MNITHSVDGYIMRSMVRRANCGKRPYYLSTIHDSLWSSPVNMNKVRRSYNKELSLIVEDPGFTDKLLYELGRPDLSFAWDKGDDITKDREVLAAMVLQANYTLS